MLSFFILSAKVLLPENKEKVGVQIKERESEYSIESVVFVVCFVVLWLCIGIN